MSADTQVERRAHAREAWAVAGGSLLAAIAFTWPLVLHLQTRARDLKDTLFQAWTIDWVQHAVEHLHNPYEANIFAPEHTTLAYSDTLFGVALPTLPLRWLGMSPIGVLNVVIILGFATSAAAAYLFVRYVTGSRFAAAVGGAAYAFGPFGALAARHVHVAVRPGVPLAAAAAWWLAERARAGQRLVGPVIATVAVIAWQATVSFYPATFALIAVVVVLVVRLGSLGRRGMIAAAGALAGSAVSLALLAIPNLIVASRLPDYGYSLAEFGPGGANFLRAEPGIVVWGDVLGLTDTDVKRNAVFPGVVLLVLAVYGAVHAWRRRGAARVHAITGVALVGVGGLVALGTSATGWRRFAPYRVLYEIGPPFDALRAVGRGWMIALCGAGLLAGLGAIGISAMVRARAAQPARALAAVGTLLVALLVLEGYDPWFDRPTARIAAVDVELAKERRRPGGVVNLPMNAHETLDLLIFEQTKYIYSASAHHRRTPNGYSGYSPPSYVRNSRRLWSLPDADALALLRRIGVRYVVVHPKVVGTPWEHLRNPDEARPLKYLGRFGSAELYEVPQRDLTPPNPSK